MWEGHLMSLIDYYHMSLFVFEKRGGNNILLKPFSAPDLVNLFYNKKDLFNSMDPPKWFGKNDFHASHRSNLLRKDPTYYGRYGWRENSNLPYIWPV